MVFSEGTGDSILRSMESDIEQLLDATWDLADIKSTIVTTYRECQARCLLQSSKFLCELMSILSDVFVHNDELFIADKHVDKTYLRCIAYFNRREYDRAAYFARGESSPRTKFLHFYSRYQAAETKRADGLAEIVSNLSDLRAQDQRLKNLYWDLKHEQDSLDGFSLYLFGVIQKHIGLVDSAILSFQKALHQEPYLWAAWCELSLLASDREHLMQLRLPMNWMTLLFIGSALAGIDSSDPLVLRIYRRFDDVFPDCPYIKTQMAVVYHNQLPNATELAEEIFLELRNSDPCRLESFDSYASILYLKEKRQDLTQLAQAMHAVDPHRSETCCVIGNVYSFRGQHAPALLYFKKAAKINVKYLPAWISMGNEYAAVKNINAAIQCFQQVIELNKRDYRAWHSLSLMYDNGKLPLQCIYYQIRAQKLRPRCPKMLTMLAERLEAIKRFDEAKICLWKAYKLSQGKEGDEDEPPIFRLAKFCEGHDDPENARWAYEKFFNLTYYTESLKDAELAEPQLALAALFLCNYYTTRDTRKAHRFLQVLEEIEYALEDAKVLREKLQLETSIVEVDMTNT